MTSRPIVSLAVRSYPIGQLVFGYATTGQSVAWSVQISELKRRVTALQTQPVGLGPKIASSSGTYER